MFGLFSVTKSRTMEPNLSLLGSGGSKDDASVVLDDSTDLNTNEFPLNTVPLDNQVAGHSFKDGKYMIGK